jgi:dihydrofolate reductase
MSVLASTVIRLGRIDGYCLDVNPVILGRGKPIFPESDDKDPLRLLETRAFGCGAVLLRYQHADERH